VNKKSYAIAGGLTLALALWMTSGVIGGGEPAPGEAQTPARAEPRLMSVQVREQRAEPVQRSLTSQGQVEPFRAVEVKAETAGQVVEVLAEKGAFVKRGQPLIKLAMNDRQARLAKVRALVNQRTQDYEAQRKLADEGFQSQSAMRQIYTGLQEARADLEAIKLDIERTTLRAPFDGVLNARPVELGAYVTPGTPVATIVDLDPLKVSVDIPQQEIAQLRTGQLAEIAVTGGRTLQGRVDFISAMADTGSRTYRVELQVPNQEQAIPAGLSAEVRLPVETVSAHFLSPAMLGLDPDGKLGVKTVDAAQTVQFHPVNVVRTQADGVWVTGLPEQARLITVGHAYVKAGEKVQPVAAAATGDDRLAGSGR
jgi:multidrug efflux system membrane fusion protein